jgi:hypothetical protein
MTTATVLYLIQNEVVDQERFELAFYHLFITLGVNIDL